MTIAAPLRMTADEFIAWAMDQPQGRYELAAGEVIAMAPERVAHARVKNAVVRAFERAIEKAELACEAFVDGMAVRIDDDTVYEPDALVRCGSPLADEAVTLDDPVIVVEVLSPSTRARDSGAKLDDYFRLPSVRHYLIIKTDPPAVIHHGRDEVGAIATHILREGALRLEPPGIDIALDEIFARGRPDRRG